LDDSLFNEYFSPGDIPHWPCPTCAKGTLRLDKTDFHEAYDAATQETKDEDFFEAEWTRFVFHGLLRCGNCPEKVAFCGNGKIEEEYDVSSDRGWKYFRRFSPKYFSPSFRLIELENLEVIPENVLISLNNACELYWGDLDACANRIRTTVEYILDDLKVSRGNLDSLHSRIKKLDSLKFPEVKTILEAVKWIGNAGSHELGKLERKSVLDGFRMLEHCLAVLYPKPPVDSAPILALAKAINIAKGPARP
jgi:hypothetical protein